LAPRQRTKNPLASFYLKASSKSIFLEQIHIDFVLFNREFYEMNHVDQQSLLARNTPLFVQLYIGQFLLRGPRHVPFGEDVQQMKLTTYYIDDQTRFLERFNTVTNLFVDGANLKEYAHLIWTLRGLPELDCLKQRAIVAYTILFYYDQRVPRKNCLKLNTTFDCLVRMCNNCLPLSNLTSNLTEMANFCDRNICW